MRRSLDSHSNVTELQATGGKARADAMVRSHNAPCRRHRVTLSVSEADANGTSLKSVPVTAGSEGAE